MGSFKIPFILGHENGGWVEKLGPGATGFAPGEPVIVTEIEFNKFGFGSQGAWPGPTIPMTTPVVS